MFWFRNLCNANKLKLLINLLIRLFLSSYIVRKREQSSRASKKIIEFIERILAWLNKPSFSRYYHQFFFYLLNFLYTNCLLHGWVTRKSTILFYLLFLPFRYALCNVSLNYPNTLDFIPDILINRLDNCMN